MEIIEHLQDQIDEEIHDSKKYIKCALKWKEKDDKLADTYYKLSVEEMGHMEKLHDEVVRIIENYKKEHGEPPSDMLAVYNYLHDKAIDKVADIKIMWSMYKG